MIVNFGQQLLQHRRFRKLVIAWTLLFFILGLVIVPMESARGNIHTWQDGLWWAITTVSGVGYGDLFPVTDLGRVVGAVLMVGGVLSLGLIISIMSTALTRRQEELLWHRLFERLNELDDRLSVIERKSDYLVQESSQRQKD